MKTILVPTDFSEAATNAAEYAIQLSRDTAATVVLFHVYHFPIISPDASLVITPDELHQEQINLLEKKATLLKQKTGVQVQYYTKPGLAVDEILEESRQADLIVMGMNGEGSSGIRFFGSIATSVFRKSAAPVLLIPSAAKYIKPESIAFAYDYKPHSDLTTVETLKNLGNLFNAKIFVVSVKKQMTDLEEAISGIKLEKKLDETRHFYYWVKNDDIIEGLDTFTKEHKTDIIALIPHHYNLFERLTHSSISKKLALRTQIPLLALPELKG